MTFGGCRNISLFAVTHFDKSFLSLRAVNNRSAEKNQQNKMNGTEEIDTKITQITVSRRDGDGDGD